MLTEKEKNILKYIARYINQNGHSPSFRDIKKHFNFKSIGTVQDYISSLEKKGAIKRGKKKARSLTIQTSLPILEIKEIPILGQIAAGYPVFSEENLLGYVPIPKKDAKEEMFALKISGESMINAGIQDGDIAIIEKTSDIKNGDIVAVFLEEEVTLKTYKKDEKGQIHLIPQNPSMKPIIIKKGKKNLKILGKLKALYRTY